MKVRIVLPQLHVRRIASLILLLTGVGCIGFYSYDYLYRTAYQIYEGWAFDHDKTVAPVERTSTPPPVALPDPDRGLASSNNERKGVVGRISIPRLHIAAMVEEGIDSTTLDRAVGHIPGTALPGEKGNVGIAGHRDTFFRALKDLQPHDQIDFTTRAGRYHYTVESLSVVEPDNVSVLKSTGARALTIVTCFPFQYIGNAPRRFIVHAVSN